MKLSKLTYHSYLNGTLRATGNDELDAIQVTGTDSHFNLAPLPTGYITYAHHVSEDLMYLVGNHTLFVSKDGGDAWTKVSDQKLPQVVFLDELNGFAVTPNSFQSYDYHNILITKDGGKTWALYFEMDNFEYVTTMSIPGNTGLLGGMSSHLWKFIRE